LGARLESAEAAVREGRIAMQGEREAWEEEREGWEEERGAWARERGVFEREREALDAKCTGLESIVESLRGELDAARRAASSIEEAFELASERAEGLASDKERIEACLSELETALATPSWQRLLPPDLFESLHPSKRGLDAGQEGAGVVGRAEGVCSTLRRVMGECGAAVGELTRRGAEYAARESIIEGDKAKIEAEVARLRLLEEELRAEKSDLQKEVVRLRELEEELRAENSDLQKEVARLEGKLTAAGEREGEGEAALRDAEERLERARAEQEKQAMERAYADSRVAELMTKVQGLAADVAAKSEAARAADGRATQAEREVIMLREEAAEMAQSMNSQSSAAQDRCSELEADNERLRRVATEGRVISERLSAEVDEAEKRYAERTREASEAEAGLKDALGRLDEAQAKIEEMDEEVLSLEGEVRDLRGDLGRVEGLLEEARGDLVEAMGMVDGEKSAREGVEQELEASTQQVIRLEGELEVARDELDDSEADLKKVTDELEACEGLVAERGALLSEGVKNMRKAQALLRKAACSVPPSSGGAGGKDDDESGDGDDDDDRDGPGGDDDAWYKFIKENSLFSTAREVVSLLARQVELCRESERELTSKEEGWERERAERGRVESILGATERERGELLLKVAELEEACR
jgi:chemotaxis protein MotB